MKANAKKKIIQSISPLLITIGIVYGDIGTSPMYVMKSIIAENGGLLHINRHLILGSLSLIIWTLILLTTIKYVFIAMKADNNGEGGIFSLYSLLKSYAKWLLWPAMIGGAALLADGVLTPAVTITTAVEGLQSIPMIQPLLSNTTTLVVAGCIISILFFVQKFGTSSLGKVFGPLMLVWFFLLGIIGLIYIFKDISVLQALNPLLGIQVLFSPYNKAGFMILGCVFLATTGAEALYSDMGHVGKVNIYKTWPFVKLCLVLNYLGQGAWLLCMKNPSPFIGIEDMNPFFEMLPPQFRMYMVIFGTIAAIIASQALITGAFSIVSEAIRLDLLPHLHISYPSTTKGQLYISQVNTLLWVFCIGVLCFFQTSARMEAAYGLAITLTMLMTTILLFVYIKNIRKHMVIATLFLLCFIVIEGGFFISSFTKFSRGGYVALLLATCILMVMWIWHTGTKIEQQQIVRLPLQKYLPLFRKLQHDESIPFIADNLVFMTKDQSDTLLERDILYSIFDRGVKKAKAYWFLSVQVSDEPYTLQYRVHRIKDTQLFRVHFILGFKVNQSVNVYLRQIVQEMIQSNELKPQEVPYSIYDNQHIGTFRFCMIHKHLGAGSSISSWGRIAVTLKYMIRHFAGFYPQWYGLENSSLIIEHVPLFIKQKPTNIIQRID